MATSHAPIAPFGLNFQGTIASTRVKVLSTALMLVALAATGIVLAISLPHAASTQPPGFLGPTVTAP
jgi:hypothetical protein